MDPMSIEVGTSKFASLEPCFGDLEIRSLFLWGEIWSLGKGICCKTGCNSVVGWCWNMLEMNAAPFGLNISVMRLRFEWLVWLPLSWAVVTLAFRGSCQHMGGGEGLSEVVWLNEESWKLNMNLIKLKLKVKFIEKKLLQIYYLHLHHTWFAEGLDLWFLDTQGFHPPPRFAKKNGAETATLCWLRWPPMK